SFTYQAQSWNKARHIVAKVEWHPGELYPRVGLSSPTGAPGGAPRRLLTHGFDRRLPAMRDIPLPSPKGTILVSKPWDPGNVILRDIWNRVADALAHAA